MIGICAPFSWQEHTCAAIQLAELARSLGHPVSILTHTAHEHYMWPLGQHCLVDGRKTRFDTWLRGVSQVVWFDHRPQQLKQAAARRLRTTLVVQRNLLPNIPDDVLDSYTNLVCPNPSCYDYVSRTVGASFAQLINWMPGPQAPSLQRESNRWLVPLDRGTLETVGPAVFYWLQTLVQAFPELELTLLQTKAWNNDQRDGLHSLQRTAHNLRILRRPTYNMFSEILGVHGLTVLLNPRSTLGQFGLLSLQVGTPILAWDVPPYNVLKHTGCRLIPCDTIRKANGAQEAVVDFASLLTEATEAICQPAHCDESGWDAAYLEFVSGWKAVWSKP